PLFEFLKNRYFEKSLVRMGGNAGIMANALSQLGASRVIPNIAVPSKTQLSLFSGKTIYFPEIPVQTRENVENQSERNTDIVPSSQDPIHFVFDFSKGDTFFLYGTEITVPRENRFIATCDHLNFRLFVNPAFEEYALKHIWEMDGVLISGFHLLLENYPDGSSYKTILENTLSQLKLWKAKNNKLQVHLELGHFASKGIASSVFLELAAITSSIGMNEDELSIFQHLHGVPAEPLLHMEVEAVGNAAYKLALHYKLPKLLIHTREYVLTVFKPGFEFDSKNSGEFQVSAESREDGRLILQNLIEKKLEAMAFGVKCAGVYAASGRLKERKFVEEEASKLQESVFGRKQLEVFLKTFDGKTFGQGAYAFRGEYILCIMPTLLSEAPITMVGLGDTLTAGTFLRGLELDVQA
ncbi:MAG TPA: ADP-dependent glucokinase/phosphofructokinase, partial [Methanosarcina sp.]|nr:ADP-dependent glucokinase/phosphofructokinase [Methanosarcina sp.]